VTLETFRELLRLHLIGIRSGLWPEGPALHLDERETQALIEALDNLRSNQ
jgi:hypothetical protein